MHKQKRSSRENKQAFATRATRVLASCMNCVESVDKRLGEMEVNMLRHEEALKSVLRVNETVEETLLNVLLAIRQNTPLQAWFPAQKGYKEQNVIGPHPKWIDDRQKEGKRVSKR